MTRLMSDDLPVTAQPGRASPVRLNPQDHKAATGAETRFASLAVTRGVMIGVTTLTTFLDPGLNPSERGRLFGVVLCWIVLLCVAELARRRHVLDGLLGRAAYLLDGVLITAATVVAGGASSPLFFLAFMHVIAVTLMGSYLTGTKVALWDSLLLLVAAVAETLGAIPFLHGGDPGQAAAAVIRGSALLLVAGTTAAGSALNERELRRSRIDLQQLLAVGESLETAESVQEAVIATLRSATQDLGFDHAVVVLHRLDLPVALAVLDGDGQVRVSELDDVGEGVVAPLGASVHRDWQSLPSSGLRDALDGHEKIVSVPLLAGEVNGALAVVVGRQGPGGLPARTIATVESLAHRLGRTVQGVLLAQEVQRLVNTDPLTGVANRRGLDETMERRLAAAAHRDQPLSLLMIDIDHFKKVNDLHGHQVGDEVLRHVGRTLTGALRDDDHVGRFGGEEFAVVLPGTGLDAAERVAERLRSGVADQGGPVEVTVSIGVACSEPHGDRPGELLAASDDALYRANLQGRDQVVTARVRGFGAPSRRRGEEVIDPPA